jgi:hypothetical protein
MRAVVIFLLSGVLMLNGCSTNGQQPKKDAGKTVTVSGKVGYPQAGTITIMELKNSGQGWQDTILLKSNYTYSKTNYPERTGVLPDKLLQSANGRCYTG